MNKYVKAFTEIFFFYANRPYLLQNLEKQVSEQKIKSTHPTDRVGTLGSPSGDKVCQNQGSPLGGV